MSKKKNHEEEYYEEDSLTEEEYYYEEEDSGDEYYVSYGNYQTSGLKRLGKILLVLIFITGGVYFAFKGFELPFVDSDSFLENDELKVERTKEVLTKMYETESIETVILGNEDILSYFDQSLHELIDISIEDNFVYRYTDFSNEATTINFLSVEPSGDNKVYARYEVITDYTFPSTRLAVFEYNDTGVITGFEEYRIYIINEWGKYYGTEDRDSCIFDISNYCICFNICDNGVVFG